MIFTDQSIPEETRAAANAAAARGRIPQSVLLSGGSQDLRERCAAELCMAVLCDAPRDGSQTPCGQCRSCRQASAGLHPDVVRITPTGGRKTLSVNDVRRQALEQLYKSPTEAENKVFLFADADALSPQIQNTLLKPIEEPPQDVMFLFLCEQPESLLGTVLSRVTEYALGDPLTSAGRRQDEAVTDAARGIAGALADGDEYELMLKTAPMAKNRAMMAQTAGKLTEIVRDALAADSAAQPVSGCEREACALAARYDAASLLRIKDAMDKIAANAAANANENLLLTQFSSQLAVVIKERK